MKNSRPSIFLLLAAGAAGVALFALANSRIAAGLPVDIFVAAFASIALVGFAIKDYSRRVQPLARPARLLRPTGPVAAPACKNRVAA